MARPRLVLAVAIATLVVGGPAAVAQSEPTVVNPDEGFASPDGGDNLFEDATSPLQLIHEAVLAGEMNSAEFRAEQEQRLSDEAASFRELQQRAIREREAAGTEAPLAE